MRFRFLRVVDNTFIFSVDNELVVSVERRKRDRGIGAQQIKICFSVFYWYVSISYHPVSMSLGAQQILLVSCIIIYFLDMPLSASKQL